MDKMSFNAGKLPITDNFVLLTPQSRKKGHVCKRKSNRFKTILNNKMAI